MSSEQNLASAQAAYAAFSSGDAAAAMANMADDIEWIVPGSSAVSGTYHGKQEVGGFWAQIATKGFQTTPEYWFADGDRVVVLTHTTIAGEESDSVDVLTFADDKLVKFQSAIDTELQTRIFGAG